MAEQVVIEYLKFPPYNLSMYEIKIAESQSLTESVNQLTEADLQRSELLEMIAIVATRRNSALQGIFAQLPKDVDPATVVIGQDGVLRYHTHASKALQPLKLVDRNTK